MPLMKTLDTIYTNTSLRTLKDTGSSPHQEILQLAREEGRGCKDVKKLNVIANLLCHLCLTHEPVSSSTLSVYMALLGNRFPRVRKYAAEQLYVTLLMVDESVDEFTWAGSANHAMEVLSNSPWDCSPEVARAARDQVRAALSLGNTKG